MRKPLSQRSLHLLRYRPLFPVFLLVGWFVLCPVGQAQTVSTLVPSSYVTISGTDGGQAASTSIDILDESGTTSFVVATRDCSCHRSVRPQWLQRRWSS